MNLLARAQRGQDKAERDGDLTFERWMKRVREVIKKKTGGVLEELTDPYFMNWYVAGYTPHKAATVAIRVAMRNI